jgi:HEAT repeat protein
VSIRDFIRHAFQASRLGGTAAVSGSQRERVVGELGNLLGSLRHRKAAVRARAAHQLAGLGLVAATEALAIAALDRDALVRRAALVALLRINPDEFAETAIKIGRSLSIEAAFDDLDAVVEALLSRGEPCAATLPTPET